MIVLVTGGAGFIGSHVVDRLLGQGHEVHVVDNLATGSQENIHPQAFFHQLDFRCAAMGDLMATVRPEVIVHQAAQASVPPSIEDPVHDLSVNIEGTVRLLELSRQTGVRKWIYASSAAVYGIPEYLPVAETHPIRPLSPYGVSKYVPELYLGAFHHLYGISYTAFRYANVYGPRQNLKGEAAVVAAFIHTLAAGKIPVIHGSGEATRDFIYVGDVASAVACALTAGDQQVFNLSTNTSVSVNELYQVICDILNLEVPAVRGPERAGDILHSTLDNRKILAALDWSPQTSLQEGLRLTVEWAKERLV